MRVLVADDNHDSADVLVDMLRIAGFDALAFYDGLAALDACIAWQPDVALLDVQMPGLDGCEVANRMRDSLNGPSHVASISALSTLQEPLLSRGQAFDRHFRKPLDIDAVLAYLHEPAPDSSGSLEPT